MTITSSPMTLCGGLSLANASVRITGKAAMASSLIDVPGISNLTQSDRLALINAADRLGIEPDWLATVISFETAGTFSPSILNRAGSGAFGLIQFMPQTAQNILKTITRDDAVARGRQMTFQQQLNQMVVPYFQGRRMNNLEDVYLAVFYPAAMSKSNDWIIGTAPSAVYSQNAGFDVDGKGYITRGDVTRKIRSLFTSAGGRIKVALPIAQVLFGSAVGIGIVYALARRYNLTVPLGR